MKKKFGKAAMFVRAFADVAPSDNLDINIGPELILKDDNSRDQIAKFKPAGYSAWPRNEFQASIFDWPCGRFLLMPKTGKFDRLRAMLPEKCAHAKNWGSLSHRECDNTDWRKQCAIHGLGFSTQRRQGVIFNARSESALQKPMFARALRTHPAAIPASGFYEWHSSRQRSPKGQISFTDFNYPFLYLAGFWNFFSNEANPRHFTILTTAANPSMQPLSPQNAANFKAQ